MVHFPEDSHGAVCRRLATVVSVPPAPLAKRYKLDDRIYSEIREKRGERPRAISEGKGVVGAYAAVVLDVEAAMVVGSWGGRSCGPGSNQAQADAREFRQIFQERGRKRARE